MKSFKATAPAKIILFGEHAVVHGKPALAVPVSALRATATIQPKVEARSEGIEIVATDTNQTFQVDTLDIKQDAASGLVAITRSTLHEWGFNIVPHLSISVQSDIPIASGMGSGAAVSTAIARALAGYFEKDIELETLNRLVFEVEQLYHGTPSGIDNTVVVYEQPVFFQKGQPLETFSVGSPMILLVADSGHPAPTHQAVSDVRSLIENEPNIYSPVLNEIEYVVLQARTALAQAEPIRLGKLMTANHRLLRKLTVSSRELDRFVDAAVSAGAYGGKLSGGGRGGNMIALVNSNTADNVTEALYYAGAKQVIRTIIA